MTQINFTETDEKSLSKSRNVNEGKIIRNEKKTVTYMIYKWCRDKHNTPKSQLCNDCEELRKYAMKRLEYCAFGENKPTCRKCPIHCYKPALREKIRDVMKYSGPRMTFTHPILAFRHLKKEFQKWQDPRKNNK